MQLWFWGGGDLMTVSMKYKATNNGLRTRSQVGRDCLSVLLSLSKVVNNVVHC